MERLHQNWIGEKRKKMIKCNKKISNIQEGLLNFRILWILKRKKSSPPCLVLGGEKFTNQSAERIK